MKATLRKQAIQSVKSYHSHLTEEHINRMSNSELLAWAHPIDRESIESSIRGSKKYQATE